MKTIKLTYTVAALAVAAGLAQIQLPAQTLWQTVGDFQLDGQPSGGTTITTDASGQVLCDGGSAYTLVGSTKVGPALFRMSTNQGASWTILDAFQDSTWSDLNGQWNVYRHIACDANNGLYGGGFMYYHDPLTGAWKENWFIRESHDGGINWSTTDLLPDPRGNCAEIRVASSGDVYAAGASGGNWIVRKKVPGTSYVLADLVPGSATSDLAAEGIVFHPAAGVFVVGMTPVNGISQWLVRRSPNGNYGSWTTVDRFVRNQNWSDSQATCAAVDGAGRIYVAGQAHGLQGRTWAYFWLVRMSTDGGNTWSTVDQFSNGTEDKPLGITIDSASNVVICGRTQTSTGDRWIVRRGTPQTALVKVGKTWVPKTTVSWITSDDWQMVPGQDSSPREVACDAAGNTYTCGVGVDAFGAEHWITRKLVP